MEVGIARRTPGNAALVMFSRPSENLVSFDHVIGLSGRYGLFEHARRSQPRLDHGYCLDDNGRALVVVARATASGIHFPSAPRDRCLDFVLQAQEGGWKDRQSTEGAWNLIASDDAIGRGIWGLGSAASWWPEDSGRDRAERGLRRSLDFDSEWWRSCAYALLGFTAFDAVRPDPIVSETIARLSKRLPRPRRGKWLWPEARLRYDNARLPEALIGSGQALDDQNLVGDGLLLLEWLVETEIGKHGFSFTPVAGRSISHRKPSFDQQPLEAWAMADACVRAAEVTGDAGWLVPAGVAVAWFLGENDRGIAVYDSELGACCDGLTADGLNLNQGAESTLSALGALLALKRPATAP
ncbi:MAG: glycosyltransferase [Acidimicrobiia bacterium]